MKINMNYIDGIMDMLLFEKARNENEDEEVDEEEEKKSRNAEQDGEDDCHFYFEYRTDVRFYTYILHVQCTCGTYLNNLNKRDEQPKRLQKLKHTL